MRRAAFILIATLSLPACALIDVGPASSDVAGQVATFVPGTRCRVILQTVKERVTSSSQLTYEGVVERVSKEGLTLDEATLVATSRTAPPMSNLPFIDRYFSSVTVIEQSLDAPVTIPIAKIEQASRLDETASATDG